MVVMMVQVVVVEVVMGGGRVAVRLSLTVEMAVGGSNGGDDVGDRR